MGIVGVHAMDKIAIGKAPLAIAHGSEAVILVKIGIMSH